MEALAPLATSLLPFIPQAAIPLVICVCFTIWIQSKRKETKNERDRDSQELHDSVLKLQFEVANIKGEQVQQRNVNNDLNAQIVELSKAVACFSTAVDNLVKTVDELKEEVRDMRNRK